jgi:menaquinone-dependent protoporphyrinogen oxidase
MLNAKPTALFQLSLTSVNPDEAHTQAAHQAMDAFLGRSGLRPARTAFFAGSLPYTRYNWITRRIMRFISEREGGDIDARRDYEYTDWDAVERFAKDLTTINRDPSHHG